MHDILGVVANRYNILLSQTDTGQFSLYIDTIRKSREMRLISILSVVLALNYVRAANILGLFPHVARSHHMAFEPLLKALAERGHKVTVVSFFPQKTPLTNYTDISLQGIAAMRKEAVNLQVFEKSNRFINMLGLKNFFTQISAFQGLSDLALNICDGLVRFPPLIETLQLDYDVVLVENFNSDCLLGLLHVYGIKAPVISLLSSPMLHWSYSRIGLPDNPSYVPTITSETTSRMSFLERLENAAMGLYFKVWFRHSIQLKERVILERQFKSSIPDLEDLARNVSMVLVNTFHSLNGVRPLLPGVVEVGGMHIKNCARVPIPHVSNQTTCLFSIVAPSNLEFTKIMFKDNQLACLTTAAPVRTRYFH